MFLFGISCILKNSLAICLVYICLILFLLCAPRCTTKQRNTHRLSSKTSSANIPFFFRNHSGKRPSPTLNGWLSKIIVIWTDMNLSNTLLVSGRLNLSFSNVSLSCEIKMKNKIKMKNRVQKLDGYMESCSEVKDEIIALIPDDEIAAEAQKWIDYQRAIDNALDIAQEYISKLSVSKVDEQTSSGSAEHKQSHLKLPKLELPKCDGYVLKFQNFWDQFEAAVHDNDNVPATCVQYLKGLLITQSTDLKSLVLIITMLLMF